MILLYLCIQMLPCSVSANFKNYFVEVVKKKDIRTNFNLRTLSSIGRVTALQAGYDTAKVRNKTAIILAANVKI